MLVKRPQPPLAMAALSAAPGPATLALALALILAISGEHGLTQVCGCMRPKGLGLGVGGHPGDLVWAHRRGPCAPWLPQLPLVNESPCLVAECPRAAGPTQAPFPNRCLPHGAG